jgi:hypothetical protein
MLNIQVTILLLLLSLVSGSYQSVLSINFDSSANATVFNYNGESTIVISPPTSNKINKVLFFKISQQSRCKANYCKFFSIQGDLGNVITKERCLLKPTMLRPLEETVGFATYNILGLCDYWISFRFNKDEIKPNSLITLSIDQVGEYSVNSGSVYNSACENESSFIASNPSE